eukprot:27540_1
MAIAPTSKDSLMDKISSNIPSTSKIPYPLSQLENNPRASFLKGEVGHYIFFWTCAGAIAGIGLGVASFYRSHRYRMWVKKQPTAVQLKILEKNNRLSSSGGASPGVATTRFNTLPRSIDTRVRIPFAGEYRPYQWYEWGPLKLWNNFGDYPWASALFMEVGKWSIRLSLLGAVTLSFESTFCLLFGYPLGTNAYIRGIAGFSTGYLVANLASEGVFFWWQTLGFALGLGALWTMATLYNPEWGELARENRFVIEMYSQGVHKSVRKYYRSKEVALELYEKDKQEKHEIYDEFMRLKHEELHRQRTGETNVDNVDLLATAPSQVLNEHWLLRFLFGRKKPVEVSKEINEMPYEERKQLERTMLGNTLALNYNQYPFKLLVRHRPQFYAMNKHKLRDDSDTAKLVQQRSEFKQKKKTNVFHQKLKKKVDLRILS